MMSVVKPELACLARELNGLTWEELVEMAVQLGMDFKEVKKIESANRRLNTMSIWLDSDSEASWQKVVKALRYIKLHALAQELEEKYCRTEGSEKGSRTTSSAANNFADDQEVKSKPFPQSKPSAELSASQPKPSSEEEEDYLFVEQPSHDFFCPVTLGVPLEPYLTSCCGKHLSKNGATRLQIAEGACPHCKEKSFTTMLDLYFRKQVHSLRVFCRYENRGCGWQGELGEYFSHTQHCSKKVHPQVYEQRISKYQKKIVVSGVSIFSKQSFWYTGDEMDFIWKEAGISLHFQDASYKEEIEISVSVATNAHQLGILPPQYQLMPAASATYRITASNVLPAPAQIRIKHCAILHKENSLILMVARKGPPYWFEPLDNGEFPLKSDYCEISIKKFSLFHILWNVLFNRPMRLSVRIFYHNDNTATFVVTKNLPAHITAMKQTIAHTI